jgi:hypothetical protein
MKSAQFLRSSREIRMPLGKADFKSVSGTLLTAGVKEGWERALLVWFKDLDFISVTCILRQ